MISNSDILNAKILIVDDLQANLRLLENTLRGGVLAVLDVEEQASEFAFDHQLEQALRSVWVRWECGPGGGV